MIEEIWKDILGYEGLYEVSNLGRVRSADRYVKGKGYRLHKGKVLSPGKNSRGYLAVVLSCNGKHKTITVHRLVSQAFLPNPDNLPEINHIDEDKSNNRVDNLEWCDHSYNVNFGTRNIRAKETAVKNGYWTGLSRKESMKKYYEENRDRICEKHKENRRKKKEMIQNNA